MKAPFLRLLSSIVLKVGADHDYDYVYDDYEGSGDPEGYSFGEVIANGIEDGTMIQDLLFFGAMIAFSLWIFCKESLSIKYNKSLEPCI